MWVSARTQQRGNTLKSATAPFRVVGDLHQCEGNHTDHSTGRAEDGFHD